MKKREVKMALLLAFLVRVTGLEPARQRHKILNLARLPIPPYPHIRQWIIAFWVRFVNYKKRTLPAESIIQILRSEERQAAFFRRGSSRISLFQGLRQRAFLQCRETRPRQGADPFRKGL